jgi:RHS repeat-associated protein
VVEFQSPFPPFELADPAVRSLDLDNDKRMDFMRTTPFGFEYYLNRTNRWEVRGLYLFGEAELGDLSGADGMEFSRLGDGGAEVPNEAVKLADLNGDRMLDLVRIHTFGTRLEVSYWPNRGNGRWGQRVIMAGDVDLHTLPSEDVQLRDLNGDGLADVVVVGPDAVSFWVNRGNGAWSAEFRREGTPRYVRGETVLQQADINGNGSTDFLWENFDPSTGNYVVEYVDLLGAAKPNLLATIDNGIGLRTEIDYKSTVTDYLADQAAGAPWQTRLPFPSVVVSRITKRLGLDLDDHPGTDEYVSELYYHDGYYDDREKEFRGFAFAKKVERGDDRYQGAEAIPVHSPTTVTRFAFHTGVPDGEDNDDNGRTDELKDESGYEEEPLKGRVLWTEVTLATADVGGPLPWQTNGVPAADDVVFTREINTWKILDLHTPAGGFAYVDAAGAVKPEWSQAAATANGRQVRFAFGRRSRKEIIEANGALAGLDPLVPRRSPKIIESETELDHFGNPLVQRSWGENSPGSTYDDERVTTTDYAFNLEAWLIGLPVRQRVTDEQGRFVAETRSYFDGDPFVGLAFGQIGSRGLMHREERFVNGTNLPPAFDEITPAVGDPRLPANYVVTTLRAEYDAFGNLTTVRDPLYAVPGGGHEKNYAYDPVFHTYVERETVQVGDGSDDLIASASYDRGAGVMTGFTDFNGNRTAFQYDSFWRLVGIVKPGDSAEFPTARFRYEPGDPFRGLHYRYASDGALTLVPTGAATVVNAVTTEQREVAGQPGVFVTVSFTDGAGHKLGTVHEDVEPGTWVAKDFKRYSSQGEESLAILPFATDSADYVVQSAGRTRVASFYDAAGRVLRTVNPPETALTNAAVTETRTVYLPLETHLYDEEDINPASPYHLTPHLQLKDGLDRLIGVVERTRMNDDGTLLADANARADWLTRYAYDLNDNLTHITDSQGNQKWFRYDGLKRKLFMNDPDRGVMEYAYDDAANLRSTLDAKAQRIAYTYDGVNRLKTERYLDGEPLPPFRSLLDPQRSTNSVAYFYDTPLAQVPVGDGTTATARNTRGMLAYVQDLSGEEHTSYDARGRVEWVVKRLPDPQFLSLSASGGEGRGEVAVPLVSYRTGFVYDSLDRVTSLTYPDSDRVGYEYNARNLLQRITGGPAGGNAYGGNIISALAYRASDQLSEIHYGNGVRTTYAYDPRLRLDSLLTVGRDTAEPANPRELIHFDYEFDGVSNIRAIRDRRPGSVVAGGDKRRNTQLFQYDDLYRLTRAQYSFALPTAPDANNGVISYRYDRIGNMLRQESDSVHVDRGVSVTDLGAMNYGGAGGRQNRRGRTTSEPGPHALSGIQHPASGTRTFPYDANGNMTVIDGLTNSWDFKDRLLRVEDTNMVARYTYDYTDRRVLKRVFPKRYLSATWGEGQGEVAPTSVLYPDKYFEVREHEAPVKYVWNGNTRVARVTGSLTTPVRTQRLRVNPGLNLVSLAVTATNALNQLAASGSLSVSGGEGRGEVVRSARRWNAADLTWMNVTATETLATGTVLWLDVMTNATLAVTGTYTEPVNQALRPGVNFVAGWGLQPLELNRAVATNVPAWHWESTNQRWSSRVGPDLPAPVAIPPLLLPGDALFARPEVVSTLIVPESALAMRYYHQDHLGSSSVLTDAGGLLVSETANYAFGFARNEFLPRNLREAYQFTQKERDGESGLHYAERRYLSTTLGHFSTCDPLRTFSLEQVVERPQGLNTYAYCLNRPLVFCDPTGLSEEALFKGEGSVTLQMHVVGGGGKKGVEAQVYGGGSISLNYSSKDGASAVYCAEAGASVEVFKFKRSVDKSWCTDPDSSKLSSNISRSRGKSEKSASFSETGIEIGKSTESAAKDMEKFLRRQAGLSKRSDVTQSKSVSGGFEIDSKTGDVLLKLNGSKSMTVEIPTAQPGVSIRITLQGNATGTLNVSEALRRVAPEEPSK